MVTVTSLICESDSQAALSLIEEGVSSVHPFAPVFDYVRSFKILARHLSFNHSLRESNSCADWLVKYRANMEQKEFVFGDNVL